MDSSQLSGNPRNGQAIYLDAAGDVDGFILRDGTEVAFPPHLTSQIVFAIRPGDAVSVRGLKARALPLIDGNSDTNLVSGVTVTEGGVLNCKQPCRPSRCARNMVATLTLATRRS
jgi:hypothetical protein